MTQETAYFCPQCGSPSLEMSRLVGGKSTCNSCSWTGPSAELAVHTFEHDLGSPENMTEIYVREVTNLLVKVAAMHFGRVLNKWGFFDPKHKDAKFHLQQYMIEAGKALAISFVETRQKIESGHYTQILNNPDPGSEKPEKVEVPSDN